MIIAPEIRSILYKRAYGHIEIYINGKWFGSADTMKEAVDMVNSIHGTT